MALTEVSHANTGLSGSHLSPMKLIALPMTLLHFGIYWEPLQSQQIATKKLQHCATLKIPHSVKGDGGAVVWNPGSKLYYCSFSGSSGSPLFMFDSAGNVSIHSAEIGLDCRALWYNARKKCLEGSASELEEYFRMELDSKGLPVQVKDIFTGNYHLFEMGMGSWVEEKNEVWYYSNRFVHRYRVRKDSDPVLFELELDDHYYDINSNALVYTGIRNAEVGLYDYVKNRILLFSRRSGKLKRILNIKHANSPRPNSAGFSFCNGIFWLYENSEHTWYGYK